MEEEIINKDEAKKKIIISNLVLGVLSALIFLSGFAAIFTGAMVTASCATGENSLGFICSDAYGMITIFFSIVYLFHYLFFILSLIMSWVLYSKNKYKWAVRWAYSPVITLSINILMILLYKYIFLSGLS